MERNLEQRLAQLGRESQDRVITVDPSHGDSTHTTHALSGHSSIVGPYSDTAEEIGEYSSMIQDANIVPVLVVPRLEEGVSDYMVSTHRYKSVSQLLKNINEEFCLYMYS